MLELAGVIDIDENKIVTLISKEKAFIEHVLNQSYNEPTFIIDKNQLEDINNRWDYYYNAEQPLEENFVRKNKKVTEKNAQNFVDIGKEGERIVYEHEVTRIRTFNQRLVNKVINVSNQKGLGYDIVSIWGKII